MVWTSSNVVAGNDVLATDLNTLRADVIEVFEKAPPIGSIIMWAGGSGDVPDEWKLCDGSAISRATYSDLFTIQGVTFGAGNGSTTFNIPDMRDRFVVGAGTSYSANAKGGSASVTLTTSQMPTHTHTITPRITTEDGTTSWGNTYGAPEVAVRRHVYPTASNTGGGSSHENRPPYIGILYIIKVL